MLVFATSCSENPKQYIQYLEGYWEIESVKKDNKTLKEYSISSSVDYFKVITDTTGFRKKVMPNLYGKYTVSQHNSSFKLRVENNKLHIIYELQQDTIIELVKYVSKTELILTNNRGFTYIYKPFEPINLSDE